MADINVVDTKFKKSGSIKAPIALGEEQINEAVVHQVVKATLAGRRQGNACTKNKALISGGGAKPFKQKGTGRARQGSSRSPLNPGGGVVFGPTPRDYTQKVNKKMMKLAIQSVIADKLVAGKLTVVKELPQSGKTKEMFEFLNGNNILPALIVTADKNSPAVRAGRNLQWGKSQAVEGFSVYEAVKYENLVIEEAALAALFERIA